MTQLQPMLPDAFVGDGVTQADVAKLVAAGPPWCGLILQASNGLAAAGAWFNALWPACVAFAGPRYGIDWFRAAYHYLRVDENSEQQRDVFLSAIDIERGEQPADATAAQVEDSVSSFALDILSRTGRRPMLYAGSYIRDLGIKSRMGCSLLGFPEWTGQLDQSLLHAMGWDLNTTLLWQIVGDGSNTAPPGYPHLTPIGPLDISVMVRANLPYSQGLEWTRTHMGSQPT